MLTGNPTKQEIFNFGLAEIVKQGKPSLAPGEFGCLYKDAEGNHCIVGKMLPENFGNEDYLNRVSVKSLILSGELPAEAEWMMGQGMPTFLAGLQTCHDEASRAYRATGKFLDSFQLKMKLFARDNDLVYKEPNAV
jgi:hypothetical protein